MSIAATQMYRSLDDFFSSDVYDFNPFFASRCLLCATEIMVHTYHTIALVAQFQLQEPGVRKSYQIRSTG